LSSKKKSAKSGRRPNPPFAGSKGQAITIEKLIGTAYTHWNAGQNLQAEALCLHALNALPDCIDALHLLGLIAHTHGKLTLAVDFMRRACASEEAPALFHSNRAEICRQAGLFDDAETAGRRALELDPTHVGAISNLGIILQETGKLEESLTLLQTACEAQPDTPGFQNSLANTLRRLGRLAEARIAYEAAITLDPGFSDAYANLASLLGELGEFDAAAEAVNSALDLNPQNMAAYINAATIHSSRNQPELAMRRLDALLSFAPTHQTAMQMRARLLTHIEEPEEAEAMARHAVALAPDNGDAALALARVLHAQNRSDEALQCYEKAVVLNASRPAETLVAQAELLIELGRMAEASAVLDRVLSVAPRTSAAWLHLSTLYKFIKDDPRIAQMEDILAQGKQHGMSIDDRSALHFALGKAWMDTGDIGRALAHYAQGNGIRRSLFDYDAEANARWIEAIAAAFPPGLMAQYAHAGDASELPVFVLGMPRSGTTLVEQILASHPDVFGAGELRMLQGMVDRIAGPDGQTGQYPALIAHLEGNDFAELGAYYVDSVAALAPGKRRIVDKMPQNFLYVGLIHLMLPHARIIHCRRDPLDTCMSCYCQPFSTDLKFCFDLEETGHFFNAYQSLMSHWRNILPADRFIEVDYEDVVADLEGTARRLTDFCGLEWDASCLSFYKTERQVKTASVTQVRQPLYRSSIGRWRGHEQEIAPLLNVLKAGDDSR
jgi:tetratricopeptide (TPR) repeat protein